jgi:predicted nucleic acid-binding Zn ribbon protein
VARDDLHPDGDLSDRDDPQERDQLEFGDDAPHEHDLAPCPHCNKMVLADAERCYRCGSFLTHAAPRQSAWIMYVTVVLITSLLTVWLMVATR